MMQKIRFKMSSIAKIMNEYFEAELGSKKVLTESVSLPVVPKKKLWSRVTAPYESLEASFRFQHVDSYAFFMSEIASLERKMAHHGEINCTYPEIFIRVSTHDLKSVTRQDLRYAKKVAQIFKDAQKLEEIKNEVETV